MLYASLGFNLKYLEYDIESPFTNLKDGISHIVKSWTAVIVLITGTILYYKKTKELNITPLTLCLLFFALISTQTGQNYYHYMTLNIPCFVLGATFIIRSSNIKPYIIVLSSFALLSGYSLFKYENEEYQESQNDIEFQKASFDIISSIPENKKNSIYTYNIPAKFWLIIDQLPNYKYFIHQDWHGIHEAQIYRKIDQELNNRQPLWVIILASDENKRIPNVSFSKFLNKNYIISKRNEYFILYQKK